MVNNIRVGSAYKIDFDKLDPRFSSKWGIHKDTFLEIFNGKNKVDKIRTGDINYIILHLSKVERETDRIYLSIGGSTYYYCRKIFEALTEKKELEQEEMDI